MPGLGVGIAVGITSGSGSRLPLNGLICLLDSSRGIDTRDAGGGNIYVTDWSSQSPATGPVASNINTAAQPYYGDGTGGVVGDGTDDYLEFAAGLGSHTTHTIVLAAEIPASGVNRRFLSGSDPLHFGRYGATGTIAVSDGTSYKEIVGSSGAYGPTVFSILLDGTAGTCAMLVNGVDQSLTDTSYTPRNLDGTVRLFSSFAGGSFSDATLYGASFHNRILSTVELANTERAIGEMIP